MDYIISLLGILIALLGAVMVISPPAIFGLFRAHADAPWIHVLAVVVRLVLGAALLVHAHESRYPLAFQVLGWLSVIAALALTLVGRARFKALMRWTLTLADSPWLPRFAGSLAVLLGVFLLYAVW